MALEVGPIVWNAKYKQYISNHKWEGYFLYGEEIIEELANFGQSLIKAGTILVSLHSKRTAMFTLSEDILFNYICEDDIVLFEPGSFITTRDEGFDGSVPIRFGSIRFPTIKDLELYEHSHLI